MKQQLLPNSQVDRGGITASALSPGATIVGFDIINRTLNFEFTISAGSGYSKVVLGVGVDDVPAILGWIAKELPETAPTFADCTAIATNELLATQPPR